MSAWLVGALALVGVALPVAGWLGAHGDAVDRLVGLELASSSAVLALLSFAQAVGESSYLIVPTVFVVLSFGGTLLFTRLLAPRS